MGTLGAIIQLLAEVTGLASWWAKRKAAKNDDPLEQSKKRYAQIDQDIAKGDSLAATAHADDDLAQLERLQNARQSDQRRPNGDVP
jgi:hypothetical protein